MSGSIPEEHLGERLVERARAEGFACAGIASLERSEHEQSLRDWLEDGQHGTMGWLADHEELRANPSLILDGARCALVVADLYSDRGVNTDPSLQIGQGKIARYARGRDYHKSMKKRLVRILQELRCQYPDAAFKAFVDTAPVPERELAARAGIGWVGKHTLIIHPKMGSYFFLGGIVMTLHAKNPSEFVPVTDHCGTCTRCIDACPTDAIRPHRIDARRCISYLTIEHRGPIESELAAKMGDWIYGCDICQEVCPHNSPRSSESIDVSANPEYQSSRRGFDLLEVLGWSEDDRRDAFIGSAMKRAKLGMMHRNALIAGLNQFGLMPAEMKRRFVERLRHIKADESAERIVRDAARGALSSIDPADPRDQEHNRDAGGEPD